MRRSPGLTTALLVALWTIFSLFYYNIFNLVPYYYKSNIIKYKPKIINVYNTYFDEYGDFLIKTAGCSIPNYERRIECKSSKILKRNCERRHIFIDALSEGFIVFTINEDLIKNKSPYKCCYEFVTRASSSTYGINDTKVVFSECVPFNNGTKAKLEEEVISVKCSSNEKNKSYEFYTDAYIMVKKVPKEKTNELKKWNVLLLGMDTMSRARARHSLPQTVQYFNKSGWLDYKAYQKVGDNTYPNLMAILAGDAKLQCNNPSMDSCKDRLMWSKYKSSGYATAYAEDNLHLPDTFKNYGGFEVPPTDHYMRPFFLLGENLAGNRICTRRMSSAEHVLDYAHQFTKTYANESFFGLFWLNSHSHNEIYSPELFDKYAPTFLTKLLDEETANDTFIFFLSDHGVRYGKTKYKIESFYEERLPMLYLWVPYKFREQYPAEYYNMQVNQHRLVSAYDLHATLWEILKKSKDTVSVLQPAACPQCTSIIDEKPENRTCADAGIDTKWCSCHTFVPVDKKSSEARNVVTAALDGLKNVTKNVKTHECTECAQMSLKTALRIHSLYNKETNKTQYVVAFLTSPGDSGYEVIVDKEELGYKVNSPLSTITAYNIRGNCVLNLAHRGYCICQNIRKCYKHKKT